MKAYPKIMALLFTIVVTCGYLFSFPLIVGATENTDQTEQTETKGNVYATVLYGKTSFGTYNIAQRFYRSLLLNKLPGYKTEPSNIHLVGQKNHPDPDKVEEYQQSYPATPNPESITEIEIKGDTGYIIDSNGLYADERVNQIEPENRPLYRSEVNTALNNAFSKSTSDDLGIIYYAGHCSLSETDNHGLYFGWEDIDINADSGIDVSRNWIGFTYTYKDLLDELQKYDFKKIIIILDGCYAGLIKEAINACDNIGFKEKLYVLTATGYNPDDQNNEQMYFSFTKGLLSSSGVRSNGENISAATCDGNQDGIIDVHEAYLGGKNSFSEIYITNNSIHNPVYYAYEDEIHFIPGHPIPKPTYNYSPKTGEGKFPLFQFQYLNMNEERLELFEGDDNSKQLKANKHYDSIRDQHKIIWSSENESIATVDQEGNVTGVSPGTTTITAHLFTKYDDECLGAEAKCEVTVKEITTDITLDQYSIYIGEDSNLEYTITGPKNKCIWTSSDEALATVKNGKITGISPGQVTITLEANNKSDCILIDILDPFIEADDFSLQAGETEQLNYKIYGPNGNVKFTSSDKSIVSVDNSGKVTAHKVGTTQILIKANGISQPITVTVLEAPKQNLSMESIGLSYGRYKGVKSQGEGAIPTELDLYEDGTFRLHCLFDLFTPDSSDHTYTGTYSVDRIDNDGNPILAFKSDAQNFEMIWDGVFLSHDNFYVMP